jgi:hypothetical protein
MCSDFWLNSKSSLPNGRTNSNFDVSTKRTDNLDRFGITWIDPILVQLEQSGPIWTENWTEHWTGANNTDQITDHISKQKHLDKFIIPSYLLRTYKMLHQTDKNKLRVNSRADKSKRKDQNA